MKKSPKATPQRMLINSEKAGRARQFKKRLSKDECRQQTLLRYRVFADHFLKSANGTESAIQAGYSPKTAAEQASRLLRNVKMQEIISEYRNEFEKGRFKKRHEWLKELEAVAFSRMSDFAKWGPGYVQVLPSYKVPEYAQAAVSKLKEQTTTIITKDGQEITHSQVSIELHDKIKALIKYGLARGFCKNGAGGGDQNPMIVINKMAVGVPIEKLV